MPQTRPDVRWDRIARLALLLFVLVVLPALYLRPVLGVLEARGESTEKREEVRRLNAERRDLRARERRLRRSDALEVEARRLGMLRDGERGYVVEGLPKD